MEECAKNMTGNVQELTELQIENIQLEHKGMVVVSSCSMLEFFFCQRFLIVLMWGFL